MQGKLTLKEELWVISGILKSEHAGALRNLDFHGTLRLQRYYDRDVIDMGRVGQTPDDLFRLFELLKRADTDPVRLFDLDKCSDAVEKVLLRAVGAYVVRAADIL